MSGAPNRDRPAGQGAGENVPHTHGRKPVKFQLLRHVTNGRSVFSSVPEYRQKVNVAGVWQFADDERTVTVAFVDGDLWRVADAIGGSDSGLGASLEWAGPLERVDAFRWDWFATLTPQ